MKIQDFADMEKFESIMSDWAVATGLATVAVGADGKYISECYNFTDFCIKLTRVRKDAEDVRNVMLKDKVYIIVMLDLWILVFRLS